MRELLRIILPLMLAQGAGALNQITDRLFLAHYGDVELAACLPANMVATLFICLVSATLAYSGVFVAQRDGGGRTVDSVRFFVQGFILAFATLPFFVLLVPLTWGIVDLAGHPLAVRAAEKSYLAVYAPSGFLVTLNAVMGGFLAGQGLTRRVAWAALAGTFANIALDPLFIHGVAFVPRFGIRGAALASILAQGVTSVALAAMIFRNGAFRAGRAAGALMFDLAVIRRILRYGVPSGVTAFASCLSFTIFTLLLGRLDAFSAAASNAVFAVNNIFYLALCATSDGVQILVARHFGGGRVAAMRSTYRFGVSLAFVALLLCFAVVLPLSGPIMDHFRSAESSFDAAAYRALGLELFAIMFFREIAETVFCVTTGALRGVGETSFVMKAQIAVDLLVWVPSLLAISHFLPGNVHALWLTMPFNLAILAVVFAWRFRSGKWRLVCL